MKLNAAFRYQLFDHKNSVMAYYIVIIALTILIGVGLGLFAVAPGQVSTAGVIHAGPAEPITFIGATAVFLFISGLCGFKENFLFALQSGVSRGTLFCSRLLSFGALAVFMTVADFVLGCILSLIISASIGIDMSVVFNSGIASLLLAVFYSFTMLALGYCISILFFRLSKMGKTLVGAGVPVFFLVLLPMFDGLVTGGVIMRAIFDIIGFLLRTIFSQTVWGYLILVCASAIFALLSWLMMRRAAVKK